MKEIFYKDTSEYTSQLNPIKNYLEQLTHYISTKKSVSVEIAKQKAIEILKTHFRDKNIKHFRRQENGDRVVQDSTLLTYIKENIEAKNILVPTFTSYVNMGVKKSILSEFIFVNVRKRAIAKKESQKAKADGDMTLSIAKNYEQNTMKIRNNSLSGIFSAKSCILFNPTAHNTLTSITRTITSLSNASNEQLISGNRYLPTPADTLNHLVYVTTGIDQQQIKATIEECNLHIPTKEELLDTLKFSTNLYFDERDYEVNGINDFVDKLNGYQRAMVCYAGDLYHIRKYNDQFVRNLFKNLLHKVKSETTMEDPTILYDMDESILNCVHTIFFTDVKGMGKDYPKMNETPLANSLYETTNRFVKVLTKYKSLFNTFFMNDKMPSNSFRLRNMLRRCVVLSDTDSTCFTLDEWITWYADGYKVTDETIGLAGSIAYIASQAIVNKLAIISSNMNVDREFLHTLAMKNEYLWLTHVTTEASKHYFAHTVVQEGNVFAEPSIETKGAHLLNSAQPPHVIQRGKDMMQNILETVSNNGKIKLDDILRDIIQIETDIVESITKGEPTYLRKGKVNDIEAYSQGPKRSPYQRHTLWQQAFAPKYGEWQEPPYDCLKIPTTVTNKTKLRGWLEDIEDKELSKRFSTWLVDHNKNSLPTVYLNEVFIQGRGIPEEILKVVDIKRIVLDVTAQQRIILASLGIMLDDTLTITEMFGDRVKPM